LTANAKCVEEKGNVKEMDQRAFINEYLKIGDSLRWGGKHCGSDAEKAGAEKIAAELETLGLDSIRIVPVPCDRFQFNDAKLSSEDGDPAISPYGCPSNGTPAGGIAAEIRFIPARQSVPALSSTEIVRKIVLMESLMALEDGGITDNLRVLAAEKFGAAAAILYAGEEAVPDDETVTAIAMNILPGIPVLAVSRRDAERIKALIERNAKSIFRLDADMEYLPGGGRGHEVIGRIDGRSDETILYTAHLDHFFRCVQDNVSAVATLLGIAKMFMELGTVPQRNILFVFNAAHELGNIDTVNPDFKGFFEMMKILERQGERIVANINFEYTAMRQQELRASTSYEVAETYEDFVSTMPREMPGFGSVAKNVQLEGYPYLTWSDALISVIHGVPVYMNDAFSEQLYGETSPYIGRDHSNRDNMDIFDADALASNTLWYGRLGRYLDGLPLVQLDFAKRAEQLLMPEDASDPAYNAEVRDLIDSCRRLYELIKEQNAGGIRNLPIQEVNAEMMDILKDFSSFTDWISPSLIGMLTIKHKVNLDRLDQLRGLEQILADDANREEVTGLMATIDLATIALEYGAPYEARFARMIAGDNSTWGEGRTCPALLMSETARLLGEGKSENLQALIKGLQVAETETLQEVLAEELTHIKDINARIARLYARIEEMK
jgi:hypothetical protein